MLFFCAPRSQLPKSAFLVNVGCLHSNNLAQQQPCQRPAWVRGFLQLRVFRGGLHLSDLCEMLWKSLRKSHERRPETAMHTGDSAANQPAYKHIGAIPNCAGVTHQDGKAETTDAHPTRWTRRPSVRRFCGRSPPVEGRSTGLSQRWSNTISATMGSTLPRGAAIRTRRPPSALWGSSTLASPE